MRAGPLSTNEVIETLNRYFVPVVSSNYDTDDTGSAPRAEKVERQRIYGDFLRQKLGAGDVHVYIVRPDGTSLRGIDIGNALVEGKLAAFLEDVCKELRTPAGPPAFPPHPASVAPPAAPDALVFHLVARSDNVGRGGWHAFPSENWIVLSHAELLEARSTDDSNRARASQVVSSALEAMGTAKEIRGLFINPTDPQH